MGVRHEPAAGSGRYFAWLYTPHAQRRRVQSLLGIAEELAVSLRPGLDHQVAHVRLDWWQMEAERLRRGEGTHPLVRELQAGGAVEDPVRSGEELAQLVQVTVVALAQARLDPGAAAAQEHALFPALAALLVSPALEPDERTVLAMAGERVHALESPLPGTLPVGAGRTPASVAADAAALGRQLQQLDPARRPALAPLLVWCAVALRHAQRQVAGRRPASLSGSIADNLLAWRSARAAARHQLPPLKVFRT